MNEHEPSKDAMPAPDYPPPVYSPGPMADTGPPPPYHVAVLYKPPPYTQYPGNSPQSTGVCMQEEHVVVTAQPKEMVAVSGSCQRDYVLYSIFTTLCCCLPIGVAALIYSAKTRDANSRRDAEKAEKYSQRTLQLNRVALSAGLGITVLIIALWYTCFFLGVTTEL